MNRVASCGASWGRSTARSSPGPKACRSSLKSPKPRREGQRHDAGRCRAFGQCRERHVARSIGVMRFAPDRAQGSVTEIGTVQDLVRLQESFVRWPGRRWRTVGRCSLATTALSHLSPVVGLHVIRSRAVSCSLSKRIRHSFALRECPEMTARRRFVTQHN
jgi:hypothetical protein